MGFLKSIFVLNKEDIKEILKQMHHGDKECTLNIGDFKIDLMLLELNTTRSGKDKFKVDISMEPLDEFIEKNTVKVPNSNNDVQQ